MLKYYYKKRRAIVQELDGYSSTLVEFYDTSTLAGDDDLVILSEATWHDLGTPEALTVTFEAAEVVDIDYSEM
jgi:hypothetical protein